MQTLVVLGKHHPRRPGRTQPHPGVVTAAPIPGRSRLRITVAAIVAVLVLAGVVAFSNRHHRKDSASTAATSTGSSASSASSAPVASSGTGGRARFVPSPGTKLQVPVDPSKAPATPSAPVRVEIPSLHVASSLESLGLLSDGTMKPPTKFGVAGWYADGTRPGAVGPAVIAGHIDSLDGPGIFLHLPSIKVGAIIVVTTTTRQTYRFTVTDVRQYPKNQFPGSVVYGPTPVATLRLITCTGKFNDATHHYLDNLVVTSVLN